MERRSLLKEQANGSGHDFLRDAGARGAARGNGLDSLSDARSRRLADLTIVATNVSGCEGGAILATRQKGRILFFSMATSFTAAALTAEGAGRDIEMIIGNGYTEGWVETAFALYRANSKLADAFRSW